MEDSPGGKNGTEQTGEVGSTGKRKEEQMSDEKCGAVNSVNQGKQACLE